MTEIPLLATRDLNAVFARDSSRIVTVGEFLGDVASLAKRLPPARHVINLCRNRYRFVVGFAAALCRRQVNLLPPHDATDVLRELATDYRDLYCLVDDAVAPAGVPLFDYPPQSARDLGPPDMPRFAADQPAALLFTSGTTGRSQPHGRSWGDLVNSALAAGRRLGIADLQGASLLGTVPHQHSYGLESVLMLALQHGLVLSSARPFFPADVLAALAAAPRPRILVTTPVHLRVLLAQPGEVPSADLLLCATAPLPASLAVEAERRFDAMLQEIYGCSEAGQIATRRTAQNEEWRCLDGISLRQDESGTWVSGVPIATETLLSDDIALRDPERFLLLGRLADMVNIAGKRSSLAHLTHHLNSIDGVLDGAFVALEDEEAGGVGRLIAFAVAPGLDAETVLMALRRKIDPAFLPRPLHLVSALPRNTMGKLRRADVLRLIAESRPAMGDG